MCLHKPGDACTRGRRQRKPSRRTLAGASTPTVAAGAPSARLLQPQQLCQLTVTLPFTVTPDHPGNCLTLLHRRCFTETSSRPPVAAAGEQLYTS